MVAAELFEDILKASSKYKSLSLPFFKGVSFYVQYEEYKDNIIQDISEAFWPFIKSDVCRLQICDSRRLTAEHKDCKPVYEVTFDITGSNLTFNPGDTVAIIPHNDRDDVNFIIQHLDLGSLADLQYVLSCDNSKKGAKIPTHIPIRSSLRYVLENLVDLRSVLKKLFLLTLSRYTKEDEERRVLEFLSSKEGSTAYNTYVLNRNICVLDLFTIFKSCKPPIEILLANLPRLLPRPYSVVNSQNSSPNVLKICFSVMNLDNNRKGLVTGWLEKLLEKDIIICSKMENLNISKDADINGVSLYLRDNLSRFSMPNIEVPLILIGPGTGVAPFIGFLEERQYLKQNAKILGNVWLFYGCRDPKLDFIYEKELNYFLSEGILSNLTTCYSRVESSHCKYVQDALLQNGEEVIKYINNGASIFVAGDVKNISSQIKQSLLKCLVKYDGKSEEEADKFLTDMQAGKRYMVDVWN